MESRRVGVGLLLYDVKKHDIVKRYSTCVGHVGDPTKLFVVLLVK